MLGKMAYMAYQLDTPVDKIRQLSIIDAKKHILHRSTLAWLITNGYIPQGSDYVMANGVPKLDFKAGDFKFYMESRHWEKTQERFPRTIRYASLWGVDIEHDAKAFPSANGK